MKRQIGIFLLSLMASTTMAQMTDSTIVPVKQTETPKLETVQNSSVTYAMLDSIRVHASALYASKVLMSNGYKLAYGRDVDQKDWKKYQLHEVAFSNTAAYDEKRGAWKVRKNQPFSYIRLVYDGDNKRLCHYQVKFATRGEYSNFIKDACDKGFLYKSKKRDAEDDGVETTFYNAATKCYLVFGEYSDGQLLVDLWQGNVRLGR